MSLEAALRAPIHSPEDRWLVLVGIVCSVVTAFWLVRGTMTEVSIAGSQAVGHLKVEGTVKRRHAKSLHWGNIKSHGVIYLRDTVYIPKNTRAEISWGDNQSLILEEDSMVQFDEVTMDTINIVLIDGANKTEQRLKRSVTPNVVRAPVVKQQEVFRLMPYPKTSRLGGFMDQSVELAIRQRELNEKSRELFARSLTLTAEVPVVVPSFDLRSLQDYTLRLLAPISGEYDLRMNPWLKFSWTGIELPGVLYQVDIARDNLFQRSLSHQTKQSELSIQPQDTGIYYWRVQATKGNEKLASEVGSFSMFRSKGKDVFKDRVVTSGPSGFVWEISTKKDFSKILKNGVGASAECQTNGIRGKYYCRIRDVFTNQILKEYPLIVR